MENRHNEAGTFLLYTVIDGAGKRHRFFFPKDKGFLKGWTMLVDKLKGLGIKGKKMRKGGKGF